MGAAMTDKDDFFTDDLLVEKKKRKKRKADGKKKGNRKELKLVKILNNRFGGGFSRSVGSGNRWCQVSQLPKHAQEVFSGLDKWQREEEEHKQETNIT